MGKFLSGLFGSLMKSATPIEKVFKNTCFLKDTFDEMDYDDLLKVIYFLMGKTEIKQPDAIMQFFNYLKDQGDMSLQRRLKILALIHKSVKKIGYEFAEAFLDARPSQLRERSTAAQAKQSKAKQIVFHYMDIESWLEEYLIKHYYDYLMRMSLNLETYKACLQSNGEKERTGTRNTTSGPLNLNTNPSQIKDGNKVPGNNQKMNEQQQQQGVQQQSQELSQLPFGETNNAMKIMILFKVNNLVNFVIKLQKQFYIVFTEFKFIAVVKDIAHMILKDCVTYYNYMHRNIMTMVNNYESMVENDQMNFYELFIELIKLNSSLHDFGKLRKYFDEDESIDQPLVLNITKERARQIDRNHRKIVLRNEEIQRDRKIKLQQQMQGTDKNSTGSTYGKRLSFFPKTGSMTSRVTSWKPDEQICEVTNDDEDDEVKTKFQINPKLNFLLSHQPSLVSNGLNAAQSNSNNNNNMVPNLNLEHMYGMQMEKVSDVGGFNTDRVTYSRHFQDDKSDSTKDTKKDDETENNKSGMKDQGNE